MRSPASPLAVWTGLIVLYVVWGSTYLGMKLAIGSIPPFLMLALRFIPAGLLLAAGLALFARDSLRRPTRRQLLDASITGVLMLTCATGLIAWAEQTVPIGIAAILVATLPVWLAIFGRVLFAERTTAMVAVGIAIGLVGVVILAWPTGGVGALDPVGVLALLVSPMAWALGTLYAARRAVLPAPAMFASSIQMVAAGLGLLVVAGLTGELSGFAPAQVDPVSWLAVGYLIIAGSLVGYTTFAWLIRVAPVSRVGTYAYVNPVVAVLLGWAVLGESLTPRTIVASAIILGAVALIVTARGRTGSIPSTNPAVEPVRAPVPGPHPAIAPPEAAAAP